MQKIKQLLSLEKSGEKIDDEELGILLIAVPQTMPGPSIKKKHIPFFEVVGILFNLVFDRSGKNKFAFKGICLYKFFSSGVGFDIQQNKIRCLSQYAFCQ